MQVPTLVDKYIVWRLSENRRENPQLVCDLFDVDDQQLLSVVASIEKFIDNILNVAEMIEFGNPMDGGAENDFWLNLPLIEAPGIIIEVIRSNLQHAQLIRNSPILALKSLSTLFLVGKEKDFDAKIKTPRSYLGKAIPTSFENPNAAATAGYFSNLIRTKALFSLSENSLRHPYILFKSLCTDQEWKLFNQRQQRMMQVRDNSIRVDYKAGKSLEDIARKFNCVAYNVSDYIQTRSNLMTDLPLKINMSNLNVSPFVMQALETGVGRSKGVYQLRKSMYIKAASLASKATGLDFTLGRISAALPRSLTSSTQAEILFLLNQGVDASLIKTQEIAISRVRISDTYGAAVEARTLAQRPVRKGLAGHTGGRAGWGPQKPKL
jgi:uncharacterized protein YerC